MMLTTDTERRDARRAAAALRKSGGKGAVLTFAQVTAAKRYGALFEKAKTHSDPLRRLATQDQLRAAKATLSPQEAAIMDMVSGRGMRLSELAEKTGRPQHELGDVFGRATKILAEHFEGAE